MRAGARHKHTAAVEKPQGSLIDFSISSGCSIELLPRFCECGRIENDRIELAPRSGVACQDIEDIGFPKADVADRVEVTIRLSRFDRMFGAVDAFDVFA